MIANVVKLALGRAIEALPPNALGVRCHALPVDEQLDACLRGLAQLLAEPGNEQTRCIVGSAQTPSAVPPRTVVLPSDLAAAEATRLRNDATEARAPGFRIIYVNAGSTPGEAGLTDVLVEVRAQALARNFAETAGLPLLAQAGTCRARPIVARLEDTTVQALARYDAVARDAGEKTALPTLGFLPHSLEIDDKERPNAQWVNDFDTITSGKLIEPLISGAKALESIAAKGGPAADRLAAALLKHPSLLPAELRGSPNVIAALVKFAAAVRRFALGQDMDPSNLCGLSRRLLDLLRSPKRIEALAEAEEDEPDDDDEGGEESEDDEGGEQQPDKVMREEEVLAAYGPEGLRGAIERFEFDDDGLDVSLRNSREQRISVVTDIAHAVTRLTIKDAPREIAEGVCVEVAPEAAILTGSRPTRFKVRYKAAPADRAQEPLRGAIEVFGARRADLLRAIEALLPPEEAPKLEAEQRALLALEAIPLTCVANAASAADAYVAAYVAMMELAMSGALDDAVEKWLTHLDLAVVLDAREDTVAARLQPLHPLRVARAQLWLSAQSAPPLFPSSVVAITGYASTALYPHGERYCYHARPKAGPSSEGVEAAVEDGLHAVWSLLAPRGLMTALDVELVDVMNAGAAIEALYRAATARFAQDSSVGAGVHLRVRCAYSASRGPFGLVCPRVGDLPELSSAAGAAPGNGVTIDILPQPVEEGGEPVHLSVQAVEAPFYGLPPTEHATGWNARYIPGKSGNVIAVELTGNPALEGYRRLLKHYGKDTTATFDPGLAQPGVGKALVKTFVAYGGWPVRPNPDDSLLSYDVVGPHVIATLIDGKVFDAEVSRQLTAFSAGGAAAISDLRSLREGILGLFPCRNFLSDLIGEADARHTLGWLGILRAYRDAQRSAGGAATLTLSLDSPEGRDWIRAIAAALGTDERRADLLILEADLKSGALSNIRVVELKARTSAKSLATQTARAKLATQALTTAARLKVTLAGASDRAVELRDGLRKFLWLGAGQQQAALLWKSVLENFEQALFVNGALAVPLAVECWLVPEEEWIGGGDDVEDVQALDERGGQVTGATTSVRFRVLQAVSRREEPTPVAAPPPRPAVAIGLPAPAASTVPPATAAPSRFAPEPVAPAATTDTPRPAAAGLRLVASRPNEPGAAGQATPPAPSVEELPPLPFALAAEQGARGAIAEGESAVPPAPATDGMRVVFGRPTSGAAGEAVWLPNRTDLVTHFNVGITGTMGSGKTQFTKSLLTQITRAGRDNPGSRRPGLLVFDYKGDYVDVAEGGFAHAVGARVLQPHELPINPLRLKQPDSPLDLKLSMRQFAETIRTIARATGDVQRQKIIAAIEDCLDHAGIDVNDRATWDRPFPTMRDLDAHVTETDAVEGVPYSVIHDLADLSIFAPEDPGVDLDAFFDEITVIDLRPLAGADKTIAAVISFFMNAFFARMIQQGESRREDRVTEGGGKVDLRQVRRLLLVDEADDFIGLDLPSLKNVMQQGRAFGYGVILSTQFLHHFDSANSPLKPLVGTWVLHRMADVAPTAVRNLFGLSNDEAKALATTLNGLEVHQSVCHGLSNEAFRRRLTRVRDLPFFELMKQ